MEKYIRRCPNCNKEIKYKRKGALTLSLKTNRNCRSCSVKINWKNGRYKHEFSELHKQNLSKSHKESKVFQDIMKSDEYKQKIRNKAIGRKHSDVTKQKMSKIQKGKKLSDITKEKLRKSAIKQFSNPENIKKISESVKKYFSDENNRKKHSKITKEKMGVWIKTKSGKMWLNNLKKRTNSDEYKKDARLRLIKRIEENKNNGNQISPFYNKNSIPILEQKAKDLGITDLQHAENGGEFYIKELGYWVDGYSKEKNIVIEIDENHHNYQKEKDIKRQKEIEQFLKCKFIRINELTKKEYEIN